MLRNNPEQYPYTDGNTILYYQPDTAKFTPEGVLSDNILPMTGYPFNLSMGTIHYIDLKLTNTIITITDNVIEADKPIFIEYKGNILRSEEHTSELQSPDHIV